MPVIDFSITIMKKQIKTNKGMNKRANNEINSWSTINVMTWISVLH